MRSRGGRTIKVNPVDDDPQVQDHPERGRIEALFDQNLFRMHVRRERSSAYWFAATLWGVSGLALGAILGGFMTFLVITGSADTIRNNLIAGAAMDEARETVNNRPSLVDPARDNPQQQP